MAEGFSKDTINYLVELRARNDREWYMGHKDDYERYVLKPFQALVAALTPTVLKIDPLIETTPAVGKTISRVRRDTRFTHDKTLYRDRAWIIFEQKTKEDAVIPGFYFELTPSMYRYGVGFYHVTPKTMEEFRAMIDRDEQKFIKTVSVVTNSDIFVVEGDTYKRSRYTGSRPEVADWYDRKNIYIAANRGDITETFDFGALVTRLSEGFSALTDIYYIWREAASR